MSLKTKEGLLCFRKHLSSTALLKKKIEKAKRVFILCFILASPCHLSSGHLVDEKGTSCEKSKLKSGWSRISCYSLSYLCFITGRVP
jgi:hypothetical protein